MLEHTKFKKTATAAAVMALLAIAATANAQNEVPAPAPADDSTQAQVNAAVPAPAPAPVRTADNGQIQEVVVTAQKRTSTAQKTAAAVTVFDARTLEKNGVQTLQDLSKLAPGVSLGQNSGNVIVAVRGVSSRDTTEIGDPAVSISSDGFYIQRPTGLSGSIYDLERVEVLRGPQGTLYGRSDRRRDQLHYRQAGEGIRCQGCFGGRELRPDHDRGND